MHNLHQQDTDIYPQYPTFILHVNIGLNTRLIGYLSCSGQNGSSHTPLAHTARRPLTHTVPTDQTHTRLTGWHTAHRPGTQNGSHGTGDRILTIRRQDTDDSQVYRWTIHITVRDFTLLHFWDVKPEVYTILYTLLDTMWLSRLQNIESPHMAHTIYKSPTRLDPRWYKHADSNSLVVDQQCRIPHNRNNVRAIDNTPIAPMLTIYADDTTMPTLY